MRTSTALLLAAGVYAVGLVRREVHERRRQELGMADMHQRLCADTAARYAGEYGTDEQSELEKALSIHANRTLSLVGAKYRVGQLSDKALRLVARSMMTKPSMRLYWAEHSAGRDEESQTRVDRRFHAIMDAEYDDAHTPSK
ncbi:DUF6082 family protein [Streptomyces bauhiniae]|uniref:DUF6082 family protein n=1 Tax=Streptomyces bauhiniae TaxID=2340725 RepID=UPI0033A4BB29